MARPRGAPASPPSYVFHPADWIVLLVVAGIAVPIWALWIALRSEAITASAEVA